MEGQRLQHPRAGRLSVELHRIDAEQNPVAVLRYRARRPRDVSIVVGHGYSSSKHNLDFLCSFLATHGFEIFSLDFPGHKLGASGGTLRGIHDCIDAMAATVAFARTQTRVTPYTMGHSMGAMTAILTAAADSTIPGVVAIATGYGRPTALTTLMNRPGSDFRASYVDGVALPELTQSLDAHLDVSLEHARGPAAVVRRRESRRDGQPVQRARAVRSRAASRRRSRRSKAIIRMPATTRAARS